MRLLSLERRDGAAEGDALDGEAASGEAPSDAFEVAHEVRLRATSKHRQKVAFESQPPSDQRRPGRDGLHALSSYRRYGTTRGETRKKEYGVEEWLRACKHLKNQRIKAAERWAQEQRCVALGYWTHLILKHWYKVAHALRIWRNVLKRAGIMRGWFRWLDWLAAMRKLAALGRRFAAILRKWLYGRAFAKWLDFARLARNGQVLLRVLRRLAHAKLAAAWRTWLANLALLRAMAKRLLKMMQKWQRAGSLGAAWWTWKRRTLLIAFLERALRRWLRRRLASAWHKWRNAVAAMRLADLRAKALKVLAALFAGAYLRAMRRAWATWLALRVKGKARPRIQRADPRNRLAHCRCVYAVSRGGHCTCGFEQHLEWRIEAARRNVDSALAGVADEPGRPAKRWAERPPPAGARDPQQAWDTQRTSAARNGRRARTLPKEPLPTVEVMSLRASSSVAVDLRASTSALDLAAKRRSRRPLDTTAPLPPKPPHHTLSRW
ncbi:hypothetical protein M885DRAFT_624153 [Pelagophyceae sp. CCMP2097]|nr:hypothetical protein M885DRAFT_624153 [Pelagophyceae sp. CCMP2097]|mmetsp:Transcript_8226/g.29143  ORF Transcript_8226/g.29143 Transcript_8226/m.29143 type:complete len:493 (-) Transcript_8226:24-1502(-)